MIILVVFGHVIDGYLRADIFPEYNNALQSMHDFIYIFHVPVFFIVSGYLSKKYYDGTESGNRKLAKQVRDLLFIYLIFSVGIVAAKVLYSSLTNSAVTWFHLTHIFYQPIDQMWYIYCLVVFILFGT